MTEAELEAIRERAKQAKPTAMRAGLKLPHQDWPVASLANDAPALLVYVSELEGLVHDLSQESTAFEAGRQEERREMLEELNEELRSARAEQEWSETNEGLNDNQAVAWRNVADSIAEIMDLIRKRGPVVPRLAPDDLRQENERLRQALRDLLTALGAWDGKPHRWDTVKKSFGAARDLLDD